VLQLWDYKKKILVASRKFEILKEVDSTKEAKKKGVKSSEKAEEWISAKITALAFSCSGGILGKT
jgi:hypothetical protein